MEAERLKSNESEALSGRLQGEMTAMTDQLVLDRPAAEAAEDSAKRRQIIEGARQVFLAQGFDAASMGDIAKAAGVSKGTLYVYFKNKEELFTAIVKQECVAQAEGIFDLDPGDPDVEGALTRLGIATSTSSAGRKKPPRSAP